MKLGCGASLTPRGQAASGKSSRSNYLLKLGRQHNLKFNAGYQFILNVSDTTTSLDDDLNFIIETIRNKHPEHKIQVVNTEHSPSLYAPGCYSLVKKVAENWVDSWIIFKKSIRNFNRFLSAFNSFFQRK
jgi:hypothetical protein